jgi:hypothetical protein
LNVPNWVNDYIAYWKQILYLQEWTIKVQVVDDNEDEFACIVNTECDYLRAQIKLSGSVPNEPNDEWRKYILHELIHIRTANVVDFSREIIFKAYAMNTATVLVDVLRVEVERMTTLLTEAIFATDKEFQDYRAIYPMIKKKYEGEPDPNLVHPGGLTGIVREFDGFDNGNFVVAPPPDMGEQVEAWTQKLKDSMKEESDGEET